MVAISLYRGNLHKVPDVPHRWLMPARKISVKDFKILLRRRSRALSRLASTTTNPNPNSDDNSNSDSEEDDDVEEDKNTDSDENSAEDLKSEEVKKKEEGEEEENVESEKKETDNGDSFNKLVAATDALVVESKLEANAAVETAVKDVSLNDTGDKARIVQEEEVKAERVDVVIPKSEIDMKQDDMSDKEKRRQEIEEKLKILNAKKHSLVQVLKQILNAEEELKRRSSMQGTVGRPPAGLQVDTTHDSGSVSRLNTPRLSSDGNVNGEVDGGETDDVNNNVLSRHLPRPSSTSPSSDTLQKKSAFALVTLPARTNSGQANSPLRFAVVGQQGHPQQGHPSTLPSLSVSGTNYIASSPSPAASGGTSAFRDGRVSSPWS